MRIHEPRNDWAPVAALAAASSVFGPLDNFDAVNDTGHDECGFEIEIEGVHSADIHRTFDAPYVRYQTPTLIDTPTGVIVHHQGMWDPVTHTFLQKTPPAAPGYVPANDSCWTVGLGAAYESSGCEHFGVSQTTQATATRYRWLDCHPDGTVTPGPDLGVPTPTWSVIPPAAPGNPEVVRAEIEIPNPGGDPYGPAYWVKIYKTEADHQIDLEELLLDDALIAGAATEIEWELLQAKPGQDAVINEGPLGLATTRWSDATSSTPTTRHGASRTAMSIRRIEKCRSASWTVAMSRRRMSSVTSSSARWPASTSPPRSAAMEAMMTATASSVSRLIPAARTPTRTSRTRSVRTLSTTTVSPASTSTAEPLRTAALQSRARNSCSSLRRCERVDGKPREWRAASRNTAATRSRRN